jgi:hypothetical protein
MAKIYGGKEELTDTWICLSCEHFVHSYNADDGGPTCLAFLTGIPDEILHGENDHSKPLENQVNNLVYTEREEE